MKPAAVIFDLDGTLVETIGLWAEAYLATLQGWGIEMDKQTFIEEIYIINRSFTELLAEHGLEGNIDQFRKERDDRYVSILKERVEWIDGAKEVLATLADDYPIALMTGSWRRYVDAINQKLGLMSHFPISTTCDDSPSRPKPYPDGLNITAKKLGLSPEECLYIGDQKFDIDAAASAGMTCWIVQGTYTPEVALRSAEKVFTDIGDLTDQL